MKGVECLDGAGTRSWDIDGIQKEHTKFIFNEHSTDGAKSTVDANVFRRVEVLMVVMTIDGYVKLGEMGRVGIPGCVGSHQQLGNGRIVVQLVCCRFTSVKIGNGSKTLKGYDELGTCGDNTM